MISGDWRGEMLSRLRALIMEAVPEMIEERKWVKPSNPAGVPTFSRHGLVCTGETYKSVVKLTFARGAALPDPAGLFNASLEGNTRRAIDFRQGDAVDEEALKALIRAAVAVNAQPRPAAGEQKGSREQKGSGANGTKLSTNRLRCQVFA